MVTASAEGNLPGSVRPWVNANQSAPDLPIDVRFTFRMVIAPNRGQTIMLGVSHAGGKSLFELAYAAYPDRLVLAAPLLKKRLELPNSAEQRIVLKMSGDADRSKKDDDEKSFAIGFGMGSKRSTLLGSPVEVIAEYSPVFMAGLAHQEKPKCIVNDQTVEIRGEKFALLIDRVTGRPLEYGVSAKGVSANLTGKFEKGGLATELKTVEQMSSESRLAYDQPSPSKSLLDFILDNWLDLAGRVGSEQGVESLIALRKATGLWSPPALADLVEPWNRMWSKKDEAFRIPPHFVEPPKGNGSPFQALGTRYLAARAILPLYRRLMPAYGWTWAIGGEAALFWASHEEASGRRLESLPASKEIGPVGELFLAKLAPFFNISLVQPAGHEGLRRLGADAFANDYRPFLARDSWLGDWFVSLASALRGLDESERQALVRFFSDETQRAALAKSLSILARNPEQPTEQALPAALDSLWNDLLRSYIEAALDALVNPPPRRQPTPTAT